jgi:hypothetical protein
MLSESLVAEFIFELLDGKITARKGKQKFLLTYLCMEILSTPYSVRRYADLITNTKRKSPCMHVVVADHPKPGFPSSLHY